MYLEINQFKYIKISKTELKHPLLLWIYIDNLFSFIMVTLH